MTQVLVAGAGPVGLTMAHELARHGIRVRVIDAKAGPETTSRAIATHPRTLETYDQMGVADRILGRGQRIQAFTMFREGKRLVRLGADYSTMPTRFPFTVAIDQVSTEASLREALAERGVEVEWGTRLESFEQDDGRVRAAVLRDGVAEEIEVPWLVGCDGGHSVVRKGLGLPLLGESSETWLIADAQVDTDLPRDSIYWVHTGGRTLMAVPMREPGRWRMLDTAETHDSDKPAEVAERFTRKFTAGFGSKTTVDSPDWISVFTFQQRMVPDMRVGRVFVAGDAAHVHSPASGQGMNTGIQEAFNLAWKLAMVEQGTAGQGLLDSYALERVPVGKQLLGSVKRATFLVQLKNSLAGVALPIVFGIVRNVPAVRRKMQRKILGGVSGLNLRYTDSPLTIGADTGSTPAPGERASQVHSGQSADAGWTAYVDELRDTRWSLLVAAGSAEADRAAEELDTKHAGWLSVRTVADAASADAVNPLPDAASLVRNGLNLANPGDWLLIRPDGYVAARGAALTTGAPAPAFAAACI